MKDFMKAKESDLSKTSLTSCIVRHSRRRRSISRNRRRKPYGDSARTKLLALYRRDHALKQLEHIYRNVHDTDTGVKLKEYQ